MRWKAALVLLALFAASSAACIDEGKETGGEVAPIKAVKPQKLPLTWVFDYKAAVHPDASFSDTTPDGRYVAGWYLEAATGSMRRRMHAWRYDRENNVLNTFAYPLERPEAVRAVPLRLHPDGATAVFGAGEPWGLWEVDFKRERFRRLAKLNERLADALWADGIGWIALTMNGELAAVTAGGKVKGRWKVGAKTWRLRFGPDEQSVLAVSEFGGDVYELELESLKLRMVSFPHTYEYSHFALGVKDDTYLLSGQSESAGTVVAEMLNMVPEGANAVAEWQLEPLPFAGCTDFGIALLGVLPPGKTNSPCTLLTVSSDGKELWRRELPRDAWSGGLNRVRSEPYSWELEVVDDLPHSLTSTAYLVHYRWDAYEWAYAQDYYAITAEGISTPLASVWLPAREPRDPDAEPPLVAYNYWYIQRGRTRLFDLGGVLQAYTMPAALLGGVHNGELQERDD